MEIYLAFNSEMQSFELCWYCLSYIFFGIHFHGKEISSVHSFSWHFFNIETNNIVLKLNSTDSPTDFAISFFLNEYVLHAFLPLTWVFIVYSSKRALNPKPKYCHSCFEEIFFVFLKVVSKVAWTEMIWISKNAHRFRRYSLKYIGAITNTHWLVQCF